MTIKKKKGYIEINEVWDVPSFTFPGGERQIRLQEDALQHIEFYGQARIRAWLYDSDTIFDMLLTVNAVRKALPGTRIDLIIPYLPYARQDRVCYPGEAFSTEVICNVINGIQPDRLTVYDLHSDISWELLRANELWQVCQYDLLARDGFVELLKDENMKLVCPDNGAKHKIVDIIDKFNLSPEFIRGEKVRDLNTGNILETKIHGDCQGKHCFIVDDICDGGRTFIELAKILKENGATAVSLYVTHGIFSKGLDVLKEHIDNIYWHHTMLEEN